MINDAESFLLSYYPFLCLFCDYSSLFSNFYRLLFLFLISSISLHIMDKSPLTDVLYIYLWFPIPFLIVSFYEQKCLIMMKLNLPFLLVHVLFFCYLSYYLKTVFQTESFEDIFQSFHLEDL